MKPMDENTPIRKQLFSVPNLMGYFRILLIPLIIWRYVTAETVTQYYTAAVIIGISGITDLLDGLMARKCHQVTKVGKVLDPVADKLTQAAVIVALATRYKLIVILIAIFIVKEGYMAVMGAKMLKRGKMLDGARMCGKICTAALYIVMFVLILVPDISLPISNTLILSCIILMVYSFVTYINIYKNMQKDLDN